MNLVAWASARLACSEATFKLSMAAVFLIPASECRGVSDSSRDSRSILREHSWASRFSFLSLTGTGRLYSYINFSLLLTMLQVLETVQDYINLEVFHAQDLRLIPISSEPWSRVYVSASYLAPTSPAQQTAHVRSSKCMRLRETKPRLLRSLEKRGKFTSVSALRYLPVSSTWGLVHSVPDCTAQTLLSIFRRHGRPVTVVHSDLWAAYNRSTLTRLNISLNFVDPGTGVNTHHIKLYWNRVKRRLKHMKEVHETMLISYLV